MFATERRPVNAAAKDCGNAAQDIHISHRDSETALRPWASSIDDGAFALKYS